MFWKSAKYPAKRLPNQAPALKAAPEAYAGARWNLFSGHAYTHRREFNPGAPAFAYSNLGLPEFPVAAGFNNSNQFLVFQPPPNIQPQLWWKYGIGQSWTMQQPNIGAPLWTPDQLTTLAGIAQSNGTLPASAVTAPGIWGAPG